MNATLQAALLAVPDGVYVLAVSGGVDSMVLLDLLALDPRRAEGRLELLVAHYDHGIRSDSQLDRKLVAEAAKRYGLRFIYDTGKLGVDASEATAREARYAFLHKVREAANASAIIMAHHQDDVIETALINLTRGTHRRGLTSLRSGDTIVRPLLDVSKRELLEYAHENNIVWHEDSTNADDRYLRNRIRHQIVPRMTDIQRKELLELIDRSRDVNTAVDKEVDDLTAVLFDGRGLDRKAFKELPREVAMEVVAAWLRREGVRGFDTVALVRAVDGISTLATGKCIDVIGGWYLEVGRTFVQLKLKH